MWVQVPPGRPFMINCTKCNKKYKYKRGRNSNTRCASCIANERRHKLKIKMVEYKGGKCSSCGYKKNLAAITFHHIDPNKKDFNISGAHCRSWEKIKLELDKCVCLCFNCHVEIHNPQTKNKQ